MNSQEAHRYKNNNNKRQMMQNMLFEHLSSGQPTYPVDNRTKKTKLCQFVHSESIVQVAICCVHIIPTYSMLVHLDFPEPL